MPIKTKYSSHEKTNLIRCECCKAWFPLNASILATKSELFARANAVVFFSGFHRRPSFGLLRGPLYLEAHYVNHVARPLLS